jgi:hypothetical protein
MAFVPGYAHDVFVSYAHLDNEPLIGADKGWVTTLVANLETFLRRKLGAGASEATIWMDYQLTGNQPFPGVIEQALRSSATLLVIASPAYMASPWCGRERDTFAVAVRDHVSSGSRVFRVESDEIEVSSLPDAFLSLLPYKFWLRERDQRAARTLGLPVPIPNEPSGQLYFDRLLDLAQDLANELKRLRAARSAADAVVPPAAERGIRVTADAKNILLAETTDDLEPQRDELRRYLAQANVSVLPDTFYPRDDPGTFRDRLRQDLAHTSLFVQLLSDVGGRKPVNAPAGYPGVQYEEAVAAKVGVMRWRPSGIDLERVLARDAAYGGLLNGPDVREGTFEEFKQAVLDRVQRPPERPAAQRVNGFQILVNADLADREDAVRLCEFLDAEGEFWIKPDASLDPARLRRALENALSACDALLFVYGSTDPDWVAGQIVQARRALSTRESPVSGMGVLELPPELKQAIVGTSLRGVTRLDCRKGFDGSVIRRFLADLRPPS